MSVGGGGGGGGGGERGGVGVVVVVFFFHENFATRNVEMSRRKSTYLREEMFKKFSK